MFNTLPNLYLTICKFLFYFKTQRKVEIFKCIYAFNVKVENASIKNKLY